MKRIIAAFIIGITVLGGFSQNANARGKIGLPQLEYIKVSHLAVSKLPNLTDKERAAVKILHDSYSDRKRLEFYRELKKNEANPAPVIHRHYNLHLEEARYGGSLRTGTLWTLGVGMTVITGAAIKNESARSERISKVLNDTRVTSDDGEVSENGETREAKP